MGGHTGEVVVEEGGGRGEGVGRQPVSGREERLSCSVVAHASEHVDLRHP